VKCCRLAAKKIETRGRKTDEAASGPVE